MSNKRIQMSRRKLLASIGTAGVGAASAGAGTLAYFTDRESQSNELVAGEFDLKVDWQESYNGEKVEAYPDSDGDGVQDLIRSRQQLVQQYPNASTAEIESKFRAQFANTPDIFQQNQRPPLLDFEDVKPGDSGEVTLSLHLFDNPGYIWMNGQLRSDVENKMTEPEQKDANESGTQNGTNPGELADQIQAVIWHDNGDNNRDDEEQVEWEHAPGSDENIFLDRSEAQIAKGTLRSVFQQLEAGIPLDRDPTTDTRDCFARSTTRHIGFKWWLPGNVGNEVQTDSVTFDLGFYAEQCRHNDGTNQLDTSNTA